MLIFPARFVPPFVVAYQPNGSPYIERIRFALYCAAVILRRFLCQGSGSGYARQLWNGKGEKAFRC